MYRRAFGTDAISEQDGTDSMAQLIQTDAIYLCQGKKRELILATALNEIRICRWGPLLSLLGVCIRPHHLHIVGVLGRFFCSFFLQLSVALDLGFGLGGVALISVYGGEQEMD
jgi:hypothetical protein